MPSPTVLANLLPVKLRCVSDTVWSFAWSEKIARCEECDERKGLPCRLEHGSWVDLCAKCHSTYVESRDVNHWVTCFKFNGVHGDGASLFSESGRSHGGGASLSGWSEESEEF